MVDEDRIVFEEVLPDGDRSGRRGLDIERWATENLPLTKERTPHHDARDPFDRPYEIKAAMFQRKSNRPGRFWIRREQEVELPPSGMYLLVVYEVEQYVQEEGLTHVEEYRIRDYTRKPKLGLDTVVPEGRYSRVEHASLGTVEVASVPWTEFRDLDEELLHRTQEDDETSTESNPSSYL